MKPTNHELEAISVRRAKVADGGKVRYRVYSSPAEFVAVIADSALMAVKVSGVAKPYKIMRDLPTDHASIDSDRMEERDDAAEKVPFATVQRATSNNHIAELPEQEEAPGPAFVPMGIAELQRKEESRLRILSPDQVNEIIEDHAKKQAAPPQPEQEVPATEPEPAAVMEPAAAPEPEMPTVEKVKQMAKDILPSAAELPERGEQAKLDPENLSPEEVENLLNG